MAAPSVWLSAHGNGPESPYDTFLKNPRSAKDGKLYLPTRSDAFNRSEDAVVFQSAWEK